MDRLRNSVRSSSSRSSLSVSSVSSSSSGQTTSGDSDSITSALPILGDDTNVSPVTPDGHPTMRASAHERFSFAKKPPTTTTDPTTNSTTTNNNNSSSSGSSKRRLARPTSSPSQFSSMSSSSSSSSSMLSSSTTSSSLTDRLTMMNIPVQDLRGAVFYGWLWKRGHTFKTWKKRFFLLNGAALTYYTQCCVITWDTTNNSNNSNNTNNHNNHKNNNIQCLDLPVRGGLRVAAVDASDLTSFGLKVTSSSGRVLYVQAGDQDARSQWLKVLSHAPQRRAAHLGQEPLRQTMASDLSSRRSFQLGLDDQSPSMDTVLSGASSDDDTTSGGADAGEMQGYLTVRGGLLSGWKKRYVVLQNGHLGLRRRPVGGPEPVTKQLEVLSAAAWPGHAHGLRIRLAHHKELFVFAAHDADAALWLAALKSC